MFPPIYTSKGLKSKEHTTLLTRSLPQEKYNFRQRLLLVEESLEYFHQRLEP